MGSHSSKSVRAGRGIVADPLWYKDAVIYEVRTRSYYDATGDGVGDLPGLTSKLDYLADLGVNALWLLPHYPSPGRDDGYDIADYHDVHPDIGTIEDFDRLVAEAHRRGIRVITELVLNHTSDMHPWFQRARRAPAGSPERDFYVWSDTIDRYREARIIFRDFEPSNWAWDPVAKAYYWHRFFAHQPDLNFDNPAVHEAMMGVVDFWLARGVDGLRLDAVPYLYEREGTNCENLPETHAFLKKLRKHVDVKFPDRMLLAEANQWPEDAAAYFGDGDECHMNFHFPIMPRLFMSIHMEDRFPIIDILKQTPELHPSCQWAMFLRNHDELTLEMVTNDERDYMVRAYAVDPQMRINLGIRRRLAPLVGNDRKKMELLNGLLFSMPGTPVLYYGDEIGMGDNVYLGDRNGVRTPMQWSADRNAGFSRANPHRLILPIIIDPEYHYEALNVEAQQSNGSSLLWWTKRLVALRKKYRAFSRGTVEFLNPSNPKVLAFVRSFEDQTVLVVANLSRHVQFVELDLASLKGQVPVELFGRAKFPPIGDGTYMLTLGGHDFYWFSLEAPRHPTQDERMSLHGPATLFCTNEEELLFGSERAMLDEILPGFLEASGWLQGPPASARVTEAVRLNAETGERPIVLLFVRVEPQDGEAESFLVPVVTVPAERSSVPPPAPTTTGARPALPPVPFSVVIASLHFQGEDGISAALGLATSEATSKALVDGIASGATFAGSHGRLVCGTLPTASIGDVATRERRVLSSDRLGTTVAHGSSAVLKLHHRMEEGTAPELEIGRTFDAVGGLANVTPRVLGFVEYRVPRVEPLTLAILEQQIENQGTAWQHAKSELGRAYERVLAAPSTSAAPQIPRQPLAELAFLEPPEEHRELIGTYRDTAKLLGTRVAELHLALASSRDPAFEPHPYSTMDQRSKYQTARNQVGRVLAKLRRSLDGIPRDQQHLASRLVANEDRVLAVFEPLLHHRIDAVQIRHHGDLHLGRVLFTGKDFVLLGVGALRDQTLPSRRRKGSAFRDAGSIARSFHYAAAVSLQALRPEDQARASPWSWLWQQWAAASFLRGYLDRAKDAPFVPESPMMLSVLVDAAKLEKAFAELQSEMRNRPEMVWIPLQGIVRMLGLDDDASLPRPPVNSGAR